MKAFSFIQDILTYVLAKQNDSFTPFGVSRCFSISFPVICSTGIVGILFRWRYSVQISLMYQTYNFPSSSPTYCVNHSRWNARYDRWVFFTYTATQPMHSFLNTSSLACSASIFCRTPPCPGIRRSCGSHSSKTFYISFHIFSISIGIYFWNLSLYICIYIYIYSAYSPRLFLRHHSFHNSHYQIIQPC